MVFTSTGKYTGWGNDAYGLMAALPLSDSTWAILSVASPRSDIIPFAYSMLRQIGYQ
jgi:hypothetical protein